MTTSHTEAPAMIDLSRFNLTLPIGATIIPTAKLNKGYQDPYFIPTDDHIDFIAPSNVPGAKSTPNSDYPRSELRFTTLNGDDKEANWKISSAALHVIAGRCAIMEGPRSGKLIFVQYHGEGNHPGFKGQGTRQSDGTWNIYAQLRRGLDGDEDKVLILKGVKEGEAFTYRFELTGTGLFKAFMNGAQVITGPLLKDGYQFDMKSYAKDTWYPKAGVYSQEPVGGQGRGWVRYFDLKVFDGEAANAPALGLPAGTPATTPTPEPAPSAPAKRAISDLAREVTEAVSRFKSGDITSQDALAAVQALKVEADDKFEKSEERSALYHQVTEAKATIKAAGTTKPTTPAKPTPSTPETAEGGESIKDALSAMEDVLDDLPDSSAAKLRALIDKMRGLVA